MQALLVVKALALSTTSAYLTENTLTCRQAAATLKHYSYALLPHPMQYDHLLRLKTHIMTTCTRKT